MVSRYGHELTGRSERELTGWQIRRPDGTVPSADELPLVRAVRHGEVVTNQEWAIERPDGTLVYLLCNAGPIRDASGNVTGGVIAFRDISERKQIEQRIREAQRMESVGMLAAGVAHDFNNLLTSVLGGSSLALDLLDPGHPSAELLADVVRAGERGSHLTAQLLAYSGQGRFVVRETRISDVVRHMRDLLRNSVPPNIDLRFELRDDLPDARLDAGQVQQLLMSLVMNAGEAIGERHGAITVATGIETLPASEGAPGTWAGDPPAPGTYVYLEVRDTGCGMDAGTMSRMLEPFFSTKFMGRGLGLSAAHGIAKGHHGGMRVVSAPGEGSTFRALFPAVAAPAAASGQPRGTVLVVDDEELVARVAKASLERAGYPVLIGRFRRSSRGRGGKARRRDCPGPVGFEDARHARRRSPGAHAQHPPRPQSAGLDRL